MKMQISASIAALEIDTYYFRFQLKNLESRRMSAFILELAAMHNLFFNRIDLKLLFVFGKIYLPGRSKIRPKMYNDS